MKTPWICLFLLFSFVVWADPVLAPPSEMALDSPWTSPVSLELPGNGNYRLEALGLGGEPVEVVLERSEGRGAWKPWVTNKNLRGNVEVGLEWSAATGESWRVRPSRPVSKTVIIRLKKTNFASLKESLRQGFAVASDDTLPLRLRKELPLGTGGAALTAVAGPRGEFWVGWLIAQGTAAEVWDLVSEKRLGSPLAANGGGPWTSLKLEPAGPELIAQRPGDAEARLWSGLDWTVEAPPRGTSLVTSHGTFRFETAPFVRVYRATAAGWEDLQLPANRLLDRALLGSTDDGLYALLASSTGRERVFYVWNHQGWTALPPPPAEGPPVPGLWAATNGAGSLFQIDGTPSGLVLRQFDGADWRPALDLSSLTPGGLQAVTLVPPSPYSKTGSLVVATNHVAVYDLP